VMRLVLLEIGKAIERSVVAESGLAAANIVAAALGESGLIVIEMRVWLAVGVFLLVFSKSNGLVGCCTSS
jgi:hypothetical protein